MLCATFLLISGAAGAQMVLTPSVIASGGGTAETANLHVSWTIGDLAVATLTGGNMMITQGFQQPFDVDVGTYPEEALWEISLYPNPVKDVLMVRFGMEQPADFLIEVRDMTGRILFVREHRHVLPGQVLRINTSEYSEGIYVVKLSSPDQGRIRVAGFSKL